MNPAHIAPRCYNREPYHANLLLQDGWNPDGSRHMVEVEHRMSTGCKIHEGRGIGPNGESYPEAHGWLPWCERCRWNPEGDDNVQES